MLDEREPRNLAVRDLETLLDDRHARAEDVLLAPVGERLVRGALPMAPSRSRHVALPYACATRKSCNAGAERGVADEIVELLENARRLVVDDRAVVALGLIEIARAAARRASCRRSGRRRRPPACCAGRTTSTDSADASRSCIFAAM